MYGRGGLMLGRRTTNLRIEMEGLTSPVQFYPVSNQGKRVKLYILQSIWLLSIV